ncbi:MAG TPA: amidase [Gammaproteobacteria bacterium]|nr:amidase [Gammaproteobacteria bacterium]
MKVRTRALLAFASLVASCMSKAPPETLSDEQVAALDAVELEARLAAGALSAERVATVFLARIARMNDSGPELHAIIEVNPDALSIARVLDRRRSHDGPVGPLHGLPVVIKANIDTADAMATSAGSRALAANRAASDAPVVARLRAAGAVILGKANLSEWANFRSTHSTSGWSSLGGQTRNPYVLDRSPCGSSSGSAVAVAAGLAPLAIGTETDGSIVCPAAANGVVGIKPTLGLVSTSGIVPIAASQDTAGPFARSVREAALLLRAIEEPGARRDAPAWPLGTTTAGARADASAGAQPLAGIRLGVVRDYSGVGADADLDEAFGAWLATLRGLGAELVDPVSAGLDKALDSAELTVLLHEFRVQIDDYLRGVRDGPRSLDELVAFDAAHAADVMPLFGQELFEAAQRTAGFDDPDYRAAVATIAEFRVRLATIFAARRLDALVAPVGAPAWRIDPSAGDRFAVGSSTIAAVSGYPSVAVPAQLLGGLPVSIAFVGTPRREPALAQIAAAFETARGPLAPPGFLETIGD